MAIDKSILRQCIVDKRDEIESAEIIRRDFDFEENGNYVFVGVRHTGKSYLMYQRVREILSAGHGWDEILYLNFEDERLAELRAEDLNSILEVHYEHSGKKPFIFLDEVQNVEHWDKFVRRLADAKYRVYVTGSNARMLSKDVETTLGGRFFVIDVYPYSFKEFLAAKAVELSDGWEYSTVGKGEVLGSQQLQGQEKSDFKPLSENLPRRHLPEAQNRKRQSAEHHDKETCGKRKASAVVQPVKEQRCGNWSTDFRADNHRLCRVRRRQLAPAADEQ